MTGILINLSVKLAVTLTFECHAKCYILQQPPPPKAKYDFSIEVVSPVFIYESDASTSES